MRPSPTQLPAFLFLAGIGLTCLAVPSSAEIVWINDWDSPGETQVFKDVVRVTSSADEGFQVFRDLDGNGRYGTVNLVSAHRGWGPHRITAPAGRAYSNIVLRWSPVEHHKPCAAGFSISVSHTGAFKDEEITVSTPNSTGHSDLVLKLAKHPQFDRARRIFVRLKGRQNCGWALSGGGLVMTADVVEAETGRRILPPPPAWVHPEPRDASRFLADAGRQCVVWPRAGVSINGYERIEPEVFSLTAYEGAPDFDTRSKFNGLDFCREYGIEGIGFPANMAWVFDGDYWKKMTIAQIDKWFDEGHAKKFFRSHPAFTSRYVLGNILPNLRKVGTRGFIYLYGPEPPAIGCDTGDCEQKWIHLSNRYLKLCVEADPQLEYVHLFGEANARWFRQNAGSKEYYTFFNKWAKQTRKRFPRLKLGGPVTWGPPVLYANWDGWCKNLLDQSHAHLDFLDWHSYNHSATKLESDMHTVTGYARMRHGKWIRNAVTETNYHVGSVENWHNREIHFRRRAIPMIRQSFAFLRNPDKAFSRQFHDYSAMAGEYHARFRGNEKLPVTPMMELFKVFKPLRGQRVLTRNPFVDIELEAAVSGRTLCVAIANPGHTARRVPLKLDGLPANQIHTSSARLFTARGLSPLSIPADGEYEMPAESLVVAIFEAKQPLKLSRTTRRWEYFGDDFMTRIGSIGHWQAETTVRLSDAVRRGARSAVLRFGVNAVELLTKQPWQIEVDGQTFSLSGPLDFRELRLPRVPVDNRVRIKLTCLESPKTTYALSFASIVLEGDSEYSPPVPRRKVKRQLVWSNDFGTPAQQRGWARFTEQAPRQDTDGDKLAGNVKLVNEIDSTWGTEVIRAPKGRRLSDLRIEWDIYRVTPNGGSWQIAVSPTGRFAGEEVVTESPPGVGGLPFTVDLSDDARFRGLRQVHLRLRGTNGVIDWSAQAGPVRVLATTGP